jgi:hypothetical protein
MAAKSYDPAFIQHALAILSANNGNLKAASREAGVSRSTLRGWRDGQLPQASRHAEATGEGAELAQAAGKQLASEYREIEGLYKQQLKRPEVVGATKARDAAIVVGVLSDKAIRAEGGVTGGTSVVRIELVGRDGAGYGSLKEIAEATMRRPAGQDVIDVTPHLLPNDAA